MGNKYRYQDLVLDKLDEIINVLSSIYEEEKNMSAQLDILEAEIKETESIEESAILLLQGLSQQLADLATQLALEGIDNAKVLALSEELDAKSNALAQAISTYTPPTP